MASFYVLDYFEKEAIEEKIENAESLEDIKEALLLLIRALPTEPLA